MMTVVRPGLLSCLQDAGRPGFAHLGIGRAGAADLPALRLANALVGNPADACALEMTLNGPVLEFRRPVRIALTGAPLPKARAAGQPIPLWTSIAVEQGARLELGAMPQGCRSYLAVDGGIDVDPWLGSRSTDINAALGPRPGMLKAGDTLPLGRPSGLKPIEPPHWSLDPQPWFDVQVPRVVRLVAGRHTESLTASSRQSLTEESFRVGADSNRVGVRLVGPELSMRDRFEVLSEGGVPGIVQLPPGGQPIILGCEHPVTGGYPRIGQVAAVDLPALAQSRPGDTVRFIWIGIDDARTALAERRRALTCLQADIAQRLEPA